MPINFWNGMARRVGLKMTDKLMVGNVDSGEPDYIDIQDLATFLGTGLSTKDGYDWRKNSGNATNEYQQGETIEGVGTLYPGYYIKGYFLSTPGAGNDPKPHLKILISEKI